MSIPKTMIVTGGSRGIGAGIVLQAAGLGYKVLFNYASSSGKAERLVEEVEAAGGTAMAVQADVRNPDSVAKMFELCSREFGPVGVLINNAGISTLSSITEMPVETIRSILETNLLGTILCSREAFRIMSTARGGAGGVVVNISSIAAVHGGMPGDAIYAATKGGLDSLTMGLGKEVAAEGIRVCGLRPGVIRTEIWEGELTPEELENLGKSSVPLGRMGEVDEIAGAVLWLCSDAGAYITSTTLNVSGGREVFVRS